jgi:hypothetical protein
LDDEQVRGVQTLILEANAPDISPEEFLVPRNVKLFEHDYLNFVIVKLNGQKLT